MEYIISLLKHQGDGLLGVIISSDLERHTAILANHPTWESIQTNKFVVEPAYPAAICNVLLMTEESSDRLFRNIVDTWIGVVEGEPLNNSDEYVSREEAKYLLDTAYLDRTENN